MYTANLIEINYEGRKGCYNYGEPSPLETINMIFSGTEHLTHAFLIGL